MSTTAHRRAEASQSPDPDRGKEMGIVLGVAVLLDAFLVRLVLLPVLLLRLTGKAAWWIPRWLTRVQPDIRFSHS